MVKKSDYSKKLVSPLWQKKRLEILNLKGFKCEKCGCEEKELHVHHRFYITGREVWQYDNDVFQVLCCDCHEKEHNKEQKNKIIEVIPEKYKDLISKIEYFDNANLTSMCGFLDLIETKDQFIEIFDLLVNAINSGWLDGALDLIRDKETIETLEIRLSIATGDFEKRLQFIESNTGYKYEYPDFKP